jgi:hypothetical protein
MVSINGGWYRVPGWRAAVRQTRPIPAAADPYRMVSINGGSYETLGLLTTHPGRLARTHGGGRSDPLRLCLLSTQFGQMPSGRSRLLREGGDAVRMARNGRRADAP